MVFVFVLSRARFSRRARRAFNMVFFFWRGISMPLERVFSFIVGAGPVLFYYLVFGFSVLYRRALPRTPLPRRLTPFGRGRDPGNLV